MSKIANAKNAKILQQCGHMSDDDWCDLLELSAEGKPTSGVELPGFPSAELQRQVIGSAGAQALFEARRMYALIRKYAAQLGLKFSQEDTSVLDFGVGWGRMIRYYLKDVIAENIHGVDVAQQMIDICKSTIPSVNFQLVAPAPPVPFASNSLDIVYAYSVFSHLAEGIHMKWVEEIARVLKPGGILVATTQPRRFVEMCEHWRANKPESLWHENLAKSFVDTKAAYAAYDRGDYLYSATGGGSLDASFYGEALIPRAYVQREWTRHLEFRDFVESSDYLYQAVIVMQKSR